MVPQLARHALAVGIGYTQVGHSSHERQISLAWRFVTDDTAYVVQGRGRRLYSAAVPDGDQSVTIIGASGALGFGLALRLGAAGVAVTIGSRDAARAEEAAQEGAGARGRTPASAVSRTASRPPRTSWSC